SSRGAPFVALPSTPSIGNDSTSVGASFPRWSRLSVWIVCSSTNATATWPSSSPMTSTSSTERLCPPAVRGTQFRREALLMVGVGGDDPLHELVAHDVL